MKKHLPVGGYPFFAFSLKENNEKPVTFNMHYILKITLIILSSFSIIILSSCLNSSSDVNEKNNTTIDDYVVTFTDHDGTELKQETVAHDSTASPPEDPFREGYTFIGWDNSLDNITDNTTVTAQYNKHPEATIVAPLAKSLYIYGDIVSFVGEGEDLEDGILPASAFRWESSIDGVIETGSKEFSTQFLSAGTHIITLSVTDSDGATGKAKINIVVQNQSITNALDMTFVYIKPGTFMMGSPPDESGRGKDETQFEVTLTQGYYIQTTPVTQGQWEEIMDNNPSYFSDCGGNCPVETVSWNDAQQFIEELNAIEGKARYRLPTEAEWEYAARAGSSTAFANGPITETGSGYDPHLNDIGWYTHNSGDGTQPVAKKNPNNWGLYDMHGNVWEWVADWYGPYPTQEAIDPSGPASGNTRVLRGGGWSSFARHCRAANRNSDTPGFRISENGFRIVMIPDDY